MVIMLKVAFGQCTVTKMQDLKTRQKHSSYNSLSMLGVGLCKNIAPPFTVLEYLEHCFRSVCNGMHTLF